MGTKLYLILLITSGVVVLCDTNQRKHLNEDVHYHPFDKNLYKEVLNPELCERQAKYIRHNDTALLFRFLDAGLRIPKGLLMGNTIDLGNYYQCLGINEQIDNMNIQGKYCMIRATLKENEQLSDVFTSKWSEFDIKGLRMIENIINKDEKYFRAKAMYGPDLGIQRMGPDNPLSNLEFRLAVCVPATCTTQEGINNLLFNISAAGLEYKEDFCRLPGDKQWAPVDYVAIIIFSVIGFLTCLSTCFDVYYSRILKKDTRNVNSLYICCSLYTNTRRLLTYNSGPESLECIDGIRALAMVWVILGHSFYALPFNINPIETFQWSISENAIWMTAAHITVDTFFMLSGLLVVYSTAGKLTGGKLLRSLHTFYLNRLLRMFPVLAATVLFESSLYNRMSDGPLWSAPASNVLRCRQYWWSTLLHIQNFVNPQNLCIGVTWYLSLDVQLHILSPIVLYWVLSRRKYTAWAALTAGMLSVLISSTLYIFHNNFPSGIISPNRVGDMDDYFVYYYVNILTRASPFCVGMIFGYLLHTWKGKPLKINKALLLVFWCCSFLLKGAIIYCMYVNIQLDWDNQIADNLFNSFMRPLWTLALGWIIFACVKGYGGPINWFLSLQIWKLPARISYAMYIIHFSIMTAMYYSAVTPVYFQVSSIMFNFFAFFVLTLILAFIVTVVFDSPFSILVKVLLGTGSRKSSDSIKEEIVSNMTCVIADKEKSTASS